MHSPRELGFAMPPEWAPHAATWLSWPFDDALWEGHLEGVRRDVAELVATVLRFEPVVLNVRDDDSEADARRRLAPVGAPAERLAFHRLPLNDAWCRDNGPLFVVDGRGRVALTDWRFNAWGGKYPPWDDDDRAPRRARSPSGWGCGASRSPTSWRAAPWRSTAGACA
ncbi:MAG: agmatine deiminase family protein [Deinococcales bacterium]